MSGQRFTVSAEFDTLDEALTLARRLDAEGLAPTVDLGLDEEQHQHLLDWRDCGKSGHEEGCYIAECRECGYQSADCDEGDEPPAGTYGRTAQPCADCGERAGGWHSPRGLICSPCHESSLRPPCDCDQSGSGYSLCRYCFDEQVGGEEVGE
jgi:hypothetical protein